MRAKNVKVQKVKMTNSQQFKQEENFKKCLFQSADTRK